LTEKPTLFITGSSGFVGRVLLQELEPKEYSFIALLSRSELILPENLASTDNVTVVRAGIEEVDRYSQYLNSNCRIIHLAGLTGKAPRADYFRVNTDGTECLVKAATNAKARKFVFVSSIAVSFTDREGYHYAESKQRAEDVLSQSKLDYCIVRPTIILGSGAPIWNSLSALAKGPLILQPGNGRAQIQPIDVGDLAGLLLELQSSDQCRNQVLELGGPEKITMGDFLQRIHRAYKSKNGLVLPLPLGLIMWSLRFFERHISEGLPVSSGQFTSFCNDGTITANPFILEHHAKLKGIDQMMTELVESDSVTNKTSTELECETYTRYLSGESADRYVVDVYSRALESVECLVEPTTNRFDLLLARLSVKHPILTRAVDGYCRFFYRAAPVRKKLILLLAILESKGKYAEILDTADALPRAKTLLHVVVQSTISVLVIGIATLVLLPLRRLIDQGVVEEARS